jgi:hypothetical protein
MLLPFPTQYRKSRRARVQFGAPPPTPPVNPVYIQQVLAGGTTADWVFDADITDVINVAPLRISGASATGVVFIGNNVLRVSYAIVIDIGQPWTYDGSTVATFANGGTLQPGSGTTEEG